MAIGDPAPPPLPRPPVKICDVTGFTDDELQCHNALLKSLNLFLKLPRQHPSENVEFVAAIHQLQGILSTRILRRIYPNGWPTHSPESNDRTAD